MTGFQAKEMQFEEQIPKALIHELSIIRQKVNTIEGELDSVKCYVLMTRNAKQNQKSNNFYGIASS